MNMKSKTIIPEGYEIDIQNSTFEEIIFKKKRIAPHLQFDNPKWEDLKEVTGYCINTYSKIIPPTTVEEQEYFTDKFNKNIFPSREEAEASLALCQLLQWRNFYNDGWKPNFKSNQEMIFAISNFKDVISKGVVLHQNVTMYFKSKEIRDKFFDDFQDLLEVAKPLL